MNMQLTAKQICLVLMAAWMSTIIGCNSQPNDRPELGVVSGVVTLDGKPLPGMMVTFTPDKGRSSFGMTNENGRYELQYLRDTKGAKIGKHKVSVTTPEGDDSDPEVPRVKETVPEKYNEKTELSAVVEPGENTFDFQLTSK